MDDVTEYTDLQECIYYDGEERIIRRSFFNHAKCSVYVNPNECRVIIRDHEGKIIRSLKGLYVDFNSIVDSIDNKTEITYFVNIHV